MRKGKEASVDELVKSVLKDLGVSKQYMEYEAKNIWPVIVGRLIASKTTKIDVYNGKIYVSFNSSVIKNEMIMVKEGLRKAINEKLGEEVINDIVIR